MIDKRRHFIEYFEKLYGRKPTHEDAKDEESLNRIARDMGISRKAAAYDLKLATGPEIQCTRGTDCPCPECRYQRLQDQRQAKLMKRLLHLLKTDGYDNFIRFD